MVVGSKIVDSNIIFNFCFSGTDEAQLTSLLVYSRSLSLRNSNCSGTAGTHGTAGTAAAPPPNQGSSSTILDFLAQTESYKIDVGTSMKYMTCWCI